jgi:light-regulated signal transduction histidine kinase (bacteriophytochrome)
MDTIQSVERANLSLNTVVTDLLPDVQYEASGRRCHIVATMVRDCVVRGDAGLLHRALGNIVRNAIRYTPEDSIVQIDLNTTETEGVQQAVLCVTDNGLACRTKSSMPFCDLSIASTVPVNLRPEASELVLRSQIVQSVCTTVISWPATARQEDSAVEIRLPLTRSM